MPRRQSPLTVKLLILPRECKCFLFGFTSSAHHKPFNVGCPYSYKCLSGSIKVSSIQKLGRCYSRLNRPQNKVTCHDPLSFIINSSELASSSFRAVFSCCCLPAQSSSPSIFESDVVYLPRTVFNVRRNVELKPQCRPRLRSMSRAGLVCCLNFE